MTRAAAATLGLLLLARPALSAETPPPLPADRDEVIELRLGVVCYGGISLAIYMFGQTRELHHLVLASSALECDARKGTLGDPAPVCGEVAPGEAWRTLPASARPYYAALVQNWEKEGARTRVVVDVIAGTSAGGINGILLAKALAHDRPLLGLRKLWFEQADIRALATGRPWPLRAAWRLFWGKSALGGNSWLTEIHKALVAMDAGGEALGGRVLPSLLGPEQTLELLVTATDFYGSPRLLEIGDPPSSWENRHDHVYRFRAARSFDGTVESDFERDDNEALAFAARSSASFPVAFPAVRLEDLREAIGPHVKTEELAERLFPERLAERRDANARADLAEHLFLVDGGVLNNYPIGIAFRAINRRSPRQETRRVLLYLEPDPRLPPAAVPGPGEPDPRDEDGPNVLQMVLAGKSGLPSAQPLADEMLDIVRHNQRVARINDIVRRDESLARRERGHDGGAPTASVASRVEVAVERALGRESVDLASPRELQRYLLSPESPQERRGAVGAELECPPEAPLARCRIRAMRREIETSAGSGLPEMEEAYQRLRVQSVLDQLAHNFGTAVCGLPETHEGPRASVLRALVTEWAKEQGYSGDALTPRRREELLQSYDLGYLRRNLRFVDDWLNLQYDPKRTRELEVEQDLAVRVAESYGLERDQIQRAREALAGKVDRLSGLIRGGGGLARLGDPRLAAELARANAALCGPVDERRTAAEQAAALHLEHRELIADLERELRRVLMAFQESLLAELYADFVRETAGGPGGVGAWPPEAARAILARYLGFAFWDRVAYPYTAYSQTGDLARIEVMRFSPNDTTSLSSRRAAKLAGSKLGHFGAFFSLDGRQRDYLWGRLDGAERVLALLRRTTDGVRLGDLQTSILDEERADAEVKPENLRYLEGCVGRPGSC